MAGHRLFIVWNGIPSELCSAALGLRAASCAGVEDLQLHSARAETALLYHSILFRFLQKIIIIIIKRYFFKWTWIEFCKFNIFKIYSRKHMPMFKPLVLHKTEILCISGKDWPGGSHSHGLSQCLVSTWHWAFPAASSGHQTWLLKRAFNLNLLHKI